MNEKTEAERKQQLEEEAFAAKKKHLDMVAGIKKQNEQAAKNKGLEQEEESAKEQKEVSYAVKPYLQKNLDPVIEAYRKCFNQEPEQDENGIWTLKFKDSAQACNFCKTMATQKHCFIAFQKGCGFNGHNYFSCGDGKLYQGSLKNIMAGLQESLKKDLKSKEVQSGISEISAMMKVSFETYCENIRKAEAKADENDDQTSAVSGGFRP